MTTFNRQAYEFLARLADEPALMAAVAAQGDVVAMAAVQGYIFTPDELHAAGQRLATAMQDELTDKELAQVAGELNPDVLGRQYTTRTNTEQFQTEQMMSMYNQSNPLATNMLAAYSRLTGQIVGNSGHERPGIIRRQSGAFFSIA
jgi:predicted ribosomally synthesized peptide with nif11-like leader